MKEKRLQRNKQQDTNEGRKKTKKDINKEWKKTETEGSRKGKERMNVRKERKIEDESREKLVSERTKTKSSTNLGS
jgi:hypothetical protein